MATFAVQKLRREIEADPQYSSLRKQKDFQNNFETFLSDIDAPRMSQDPDGYIDTKDHNGIIEILNRYAPEEGREDFSIISHPIFKSNAAHWRKKILRTFFPETSKTAQEFLMRHDLFPEKPASNENYDFCILPTKIRRSLKLEPELLQREFNLLSVEEKSKVIASLLRFKFDIVLQVLHILFPDFKARRPHTLDISSSPDLQEVIRDIQSEVTNWRQNGHQNSSETSLKILSRLVYMNAFYNFFILQDQYGYVQDRFVLESRNNFFEAIKDYYEPELWDSDYDGVSDSKDPFPTHRDYVRDANQNKIPDEIEERKLGPEHFYGLAEEEYKNVMQRLPDGSESSIGLYRYQNQVYVILNIPFDPDPSVVDQWPFQRYLVKRDIEAYLAETTQKKNIPITVILNPYPGKGKGVQVVPGSQIDEKILAYSNRWPIYHSQETGAHEGMHHIPQFTDRYPTSPYVKYCKATSPGLLKLWDKPHLMHNNTAPEVDEVDFIPLFDQASGYMTIDFIPPPIKAEIHSRFGKGEVDLSKAIAIHRSYYDAYISYKHRSNYFEANLPKDEYQRQVAAKASLRAVLFHEVSLFEKTKEQKLFTQIRRDLEEFERIGVNSNSSSEAAEALMDVKILEGRLAKSRGDFKGAEECFKEAIKIDEPFNKGKFAKFKILIGTNTAYTSKEFEPQLKLQISAKLGGLLDASAPIDYENLIINDRSGVIGKVEALLPVYTYGSLLTLSSGGALLGQVQTISPTPNRFWTINPLAEWRAQLNLLRETINIGLMTAIGPEFSSTGVKGYWEGGLLVAAGSRQHKIEIEMGPAIAFPDIRTQFNFRIGYRFDLLNISSDWMKKVLGKK